MATKNTTKAPAKRAAKKTPAKAPVKLTATYVGHTTQSRISARKNNA